MKQPDDKHVLGWLDIIVAAATITAFGIFLVVLLASVVASFY